MPLNIVSKSPDGKTVVYVDGKPVSSYTEPPAPPKPRRWRRVRLNPAVFDGPKLKVERAKKHIQELDAAIRSFEESKPYALFSDDDDQTGENVWSVALQKEIPREFSSIIGDAVHNLRAAIDFAGCDLIRAAGTGKDPTNGGIPFNTRAKRFKPGSIGKINGVSAKAERVILAAKANARWNDPLHLINELDVLDKHNRILTTAGAMLQFQAMVGVQNTFIGPEGDICIGTPGPDCQPYLVPAGVPDTFKTVFPLQNKVEVHRTPAGFYEHCQPAFFVALGQGQVGEGKPVLIELTQLTNAVERFLTLLEKRAL